MHPVPAARRRSPISGHDDHDVGAGRLNLSRQLILGATSESDDGDDGCDADRHAERGERCPRSVAFEGVGLKSKLSGEFMGLRKGSPTDGVSKSSAPDQGIDTA